MIEHNRFSLIDKTRFFTIEKYNCVYAEIPKVACTSLKIWISELLEFNFDKEKWGYVHELDFPMTVGYETEKINPGYFKFGFVRNPWDRLVSCWLSKIKTEDIDNGIDWKKGVEFNLWRFGEMFRAEMPFGDFVNSVLKIQEAQADPHFRSQYTFIYDKENKPVLNFTGRFENFNSDFLYVCNKIGASDTVPPHYHKQERTHYRDYYDERLKKLVGNRYHYDIELFNYEF